MEACDCCGREFEQFLYLEVLSETFSFCSWTCLITYAAVKAHNAEASLLTRLHDAERKLDSAESWLAAYQADVFTK